MAARSNDNDNYLLNVDVRPHHINVLRSDRISGVFYKPLIQSDVDRVERFWLTLRLFDDVSTAL